MKKLLVVEDDPGLQSQYRWGFEDYEVVIAQDRESAISSLRRHEPAVVLLDLGLPPHPENVSEGLATLDEIIGLAPKTKIIVVTGDDDRKNAVKAIAAGAYDFYQKPIVLDVLQLIVQRAYHLYELEEENRRLNRIHNSPLDGIIACSPEMLKVCRMVERIAPTDVTVLLLGDSGTGKEVIAKAIHGLSVREKERFVAINCAAIPENLLESELFGYERGAFTGAARQTKGKIEMAHGGTLFLDEIGDLPLALQAKLLRFLQERTVERIGGREEINVDVRVVSATNRDLKALIMDGGFREDLYYRLSEISIQIPPLKARAGDAVLLAKMFLEKYSQQMGRKLRGFSQEAINSIVQYGWPGNVREMENKIKRAVILAEEAMVVPEDLELPVVQEHALEAMNLRRARDDAEMSVIMKALALYEGNVSKAADVLGVSRPTLYDLMEKYGLKQK